MPASALLTGPNGQLIPDYSGVTANWANSPILRKFEERAAAPVRRGQRRPEQPRPVHPGRGRPRPSPVAGEAADYYEIELGEYEQPAPFHSRPAAPTQLRGYRQTNTTRSQRRAVFHYLGPVIVAQKGRPVRVKFTNNLPTGAGGNLFIPVDTTVMGSGPGPNVERRDAPGDSRRRALHDRTRRPASSRRAASRRTAPRSTSTAA